MNSPAPIPSSMLQDPVMQAVFDIERLANPMQKELRDAILDNRVHDCSRLLEEEDHDHLLPESLWYSMAVLLVHQATSRILGVFKNHGYSCDSEVDLDHRKMKIGDLVLAHASPDRLGELVTSGFLSPSPSWAMKGMSDARPEVFDFWHAHDTPIVSRASVPTLTSESLRWSAIATRPRDPDTAVAATFRAECTRRLSARLDAFLQANYPATTEFDRWAALLDRPPRISSDYGEIRATEHLLTLLNHQVSRTPDWTSKICPSKNWLETHNARWMRVLLIAGYPLASFQRDPIADLSDHLIRLIRSQNGRSQGSPLVSSAFSRLWSVLRDRLEREAPARLAGLPQELSSPTPSLGETLAEMGADQALAFAQRLELCLATPTANEGTLPLRPPRL